MANPRQWYKPKALEEALKPFEKYRKLLCIRNINYSSDARQFEEACRKRITIADDVKFLWPAPDRDERKNRGKVYLGFDTRPDSVIALQQIGEGFDFEGLKVIVERSGRGPNPKNKVASVPAGSTAAPASTPVPVPAPAPAPSESQPEAQIMAPTERPAVETLIRHLNEIAKAPAALLAQDGEHARVSELMAKLAAANPETTRILLDVLLSNAAATGSASGSSIVPVSAAGPIEEPTASATSCNDTVQPETVAAQSGDTTMQSDKEDAEPEGGWWW